MPALGLWPGLPGALSAEHLAWRPARGKVEALASAPSCGHHNRFVFPACCQSTRPRLSAIYSEHQRSLVGAVQEGVRADN